MVIALYFALHHRSRQVPVLTSTLASTEVRSTHRLYPGQQFRPESRTSARSGPSGQAVHRQGLGQGHPAAAARRLTFVRPRRRHGSRTQHGSSGAQPGRSAPAGTDVDQARDTN
uniref:Uncharacterized protein n=1 Tax=Tanacetum cinerariifolium TaxID=118510 RepID=A0A699TKJ3_TANCI|nr:hypothetical protein [Tanacetum cinerariifolium]